MREQLHDNEKQQEIPPAFAMATAWRATRPGMTKRKMSGGVEGAALSAPERLGHDGACPSMASAICHRIAAEILFALSY